MAATVRSYAKINIGLCIGPPEMRTDGFHELRTVYQTIALHDVVKVEIQSSVGKRAVAADRQPGAGSGSIEIVCNDPRVPTDFTNTCWKAAERMIAALGIGGGIRITIDKRLPVQGGMGAASSNAVATMVGIEREWMKSRRRKRGLDPAMRMRIAEEVGSDVPLFLIGGTVMGIGRGEQVFPLPDLPEIDLVVATPAVGVSTPEAFRAWDRHIGGAQRAGLTAAGQSDKLSTFSRSVYAWLYGSPVRSGVSARGGNRAEALLLDLVRTGIANDFEPVVFGQFPELRKVKNAIENAGSIYASLSGSGSTVYGLFRSRTAAERAAAKLRKQGIEVVATRTLGRSPRRR
jgi:4-diphosphocytidyl-2-C-methyl-D-erythritol kinase